MLTDIAVLLLFQISKSSIFTGDKIFQMMNKTKILCQCTWQSHSWKTQCILQLFSLHIKCSILSLDQYKLVLKQNRRNKTALDSWMLRSDQWLPRGRGTVEPLCCTSDELKKNNDNKSQNKQKASCYLNSRKRVKKKKGCTDGFHNS